MELTNDKLYERDDRSDSFRMVGDVITSIAENYGIAIDETTRQRWQDSMGLLREFDTLVDDQRMPPEEALIELACFDRFKQNYPSLGAPEIDQDTHLKMVRRVALILEHGQEISHTTNIDDFIYHRREEVDHTAELLADCATSDVTTQPGFYTKFMPMLRTMGEAANFIDSLIDYRQDKRESKIYIDGDRAFYMSVGNCALREFAHASQVMTSLKIWKQFYDMSVMRLNNRLTHGKKSYSSIKNL